VRQCEVQSSQDSIYVQWHSGYLQGIKIITGIAHPGYFFDGMENTTRVTRHMGPTCRQIKDISLFFFNLSCSVGGFSMLNIYFTLSSTTRINPIQETDLLKLAY
jgi:hypothetical protein